MKIYWFLVLLFFLLWIGISHQHPDPSWWSIFSADRTTHTHLMEQISLIKVTMMLLIFGGAATYIGKEKVVSHDLFDGKSFQWTEIKEVALENYADDTGRYEEYNFTSSDGNSIRIPLNNYFLNEDRSEIYRIARQNNVLFIEQEKK